MAYFARPDWDLAQQAVAVTASAEDPAYTASHLIDEDAAHAAKLTTTTGWWLLEFANKVIPVALALIYQYLDAGLVFYIQGNDTSDFSSPTFSQAITAPAKRLDGPSYQRWTHNILEFLDAYLVDDGYLFWRLYFPNANSQPITIGRLALWSTLQAVDILHATGDISERDTQPALVEGLTALKVRKVTPIGGPQRELTAAFVATDFNAGSAPVQEASDFRALRESTNGGEHPALLVPQLANDDEPWLVDGFEGLSCVHAQGGYQVWAFTVREVSRALPFP